MLQLRPYQHEIVDFVLANPRCNLFVPMGAGKTVSTLTAIDLLSLVDDVLPVLVVAPLLVAKSTWPNEVAKFPHLKHLKVSVIAGTTKERRAALRQSADIYCINYENLPWLDEELGDDWPFKMVVADECTKLKSFRLQQGSVRARALARHAHKRAKRYVGLTGTPAPNGLKDLWGFQWFVDKGVRLGRSFDAFKSRWFQSVQVGNSKFATQLVPLPFAQEQIQDAVRDVCLTIDIAKYFDIKEPIVNTIYVDLPPKARQLYKDMEKEMFLQLGDVEVEAFSAAAKTQKCLQLASGAIYTDEQGHFEEVHDAKLDALESVIEEANGMPVLVAYHFKSDLARLLKRFPQGKQLDKNPQTITDWNKGKIPVLFAHPASAGHGLNLQDGGNILAFFSHDWSLETYQQIIERIGPTRQAQAGHNRPVFLHHIVAKDTLDEVVMARRENKREVQDLLMEAMRARGL